ncbi:hypothetical protein Bca4012_055137 [Brassica carinata]|uniref:Uncharacterized protein n=1 Tax=Brassica carinata TaxID=52824 RepID=A0A8X8B1Q1_BRACI|nr:hypothetical protein Bca52824_011880 [Brassica carinata]
MDMYRDDSFPYCYFHPKEEYVGVCPLCLNERLLVLASKQRSSRTKHSSSSPIISLPKIFTLSSLFNRLDLRHHRKFHPSSDLEVSTSQEDSFISIKFENDGNASWERKTVSKVCVGNTNSTCKKQQAPITSTTSIVEHNSAKSSLKWRKRIGHLFHVIKLRSGLPTSSCPVASSKVEGTKVRKHGWMVWEKAENKVVELKQKLEDAANENIVFQDSQIGLSHLDQEAMTERTKGVLRNSVPRFASNYS